MKKLFAIAAILFAIGATQALHAQSATRDSASIAGNWYLMPVLPSDTATGKIPMLYFNLAQRRFNGFTGCNQMSGSFILRADQLSFDKNIILTKIACEGFNEKEFVINLLRVDHYKIVNGTLIFMIDKTPVSKWVRKVEKGGVL